MAITSTDKMLAEKTDGIGWVTFNNPERRNAISVDMWQAIPDILGAFNADPDVRVIVLKGAGDKAFVAGADISEFEEKRSTTETVASYGKLASRGFDSFLNAGKPTIAMVRGYCLGAGLRIALNCDLRIAADDTRFAIPAAKLSLGYGIPGVQRMMDIIGPAFTQEILFTAKQFDAEEALRMGLINRVVPVAELEVQATKLAEVIARNAPLTVLAAKRTVRELLRAPGERDLDAASALIRACTESEDYKEVRRAFMEKRYPKFQGR
ncbi:MAG: enoyl-CoA hydratase [Alphaproteobacteria bacterium]